MGTRVPTTLSQIHGLLDQIRLRPPHLGVHGSDHNPIGVYILDTFSHHRWREAQDMGDKTLFVGPKACFKATAPRQEMANMIRSSKFELLCGRIGADVNTYDAPFTRRDRRMQLWVVPKGVGTGLPPKMCPRPAYAQLIRRSFILNMQ